MTNILEQASQAYYNGQPIMTDEEFDAISVDYEPIGHEVYGDTWVHAYPMWSLQKAYGDEDPLVDYKGHVVCTPKLDGAAVSIEYKDGKLFKAATRGDGNKGNLITDKIAQLVPSEIDYLGHCQIIGEVVAPKAIKNSRNYAAGALNLKDLEEFKKRDITFIAYGFNPHNSATWMKDMAQLRGQGFNTVTDSLWSQFPQDGQVFRMDTYTDFNSAGYTSKHPRGAYALKERPVGVITTLLDVEWNVGRSGVVAPTAILEPILVGDATVSRATLHNPAYIKALNLEIGCKVEVIRSGEIIPRIIRRV
jgi:NAD-dependent DNA ligase